MEATPVAQHAHSRRLQFLFENHPFRHLVLRAERARASRDRSMDYARSHLEHAAQVHFEPYRQMYLDVASTYVSIARQAHRRLLEQLRAMRAECP
jgi:hypothetical protein